MTDTITIPRAEYEAMQARLEDLDDILAAHAAVTGATLPHEFAIRIMDGEHPIKVWRDYRKLSATALAEQSNVSNVYLGEVERGKKPGSVDFYKAVALALGVPLDAVVP